MLAAIALTLLLVLYAAPDLPGVRTLHRLLVQTSARALSRLSPARILFVLGLGLAAGVLFGLFAGEGIKLFTLMAPDTIVWFALFDVATIVDAVLFGLMVSSSVRLGGAVQRVRSFVEKARDQILARVNLRPAHRPRARQDRPSRPVRPLPPRGDDPAPAWAGLAVA